MGSKAAKPRVAVVLSGYGVEPRGAEAYLAEVLPFLEDRFEVHLYSRSGQGPGGVRRPAIPRGLLDPVYRSAKPVRKVLDTLFLDPIHLEWTSHLLLCLPRLLRGRYSVIWHETGLWGGFLLAAVRRLTGARLLDLAHGAHPGWEVPFARRRPDVYVAFTEELAGVIRERVPEQRVEIVPQGIDTELFTPGAPPWPLEVPSPVVLMVGALSPEKRPDLAVRAVAETEASLVIAGDGPLSASIDELAAERLGAERYQRLLLPRREMSRLYAAAAAVIVASPYESGPLSAIEAMACGKPVVSAADASRSSLLAEAGVLVDEQTPAAYAAGIRRALAGEWAETARRRALDFRVENTAERLAEILAELGGLAAPPRRPEPTAPAAGAA